MIEQMRYINIMGRLADFDRIAERYILRYDIQMENASRELFGINGIRSFNEPNLYAEYIPKVKRLQEIFGIPDGVDAGVLTTDKALEAIDETYDLVENKNTRLKQLEARHSALAGVIAAFEPFRGMDFEYEKLSDFMLLHCQFGKTPMNNHKQLETYLHSDSNILFVEGSRDKENVWGMHITPMRNREKMASVLTSFHCEKVTLPVVFEGEELYGSPGEIIDRLRIAADNLAYEISLEKDGFAGITKEKSTYLARAATIVKNMYRLYDTRKYAAQTEKDFFVIVGWMSKRDAQKLQNEIEGDDAVIFIPESGGIKSEGLPPTKLKNPPVIRFFEFFLEMYGMPGYGEFDPTPLMAVTYTLLFGLMFGDIGQGAVIAVIGWLLYKLRGMKIGAIMSVIGVSSAVFGALYGSVFGFEIPALWRKPADDINTTLFIAIGIGVALLIISMAVNIINAAKKKDYAKLLFSPNGVAGLVFYASVVAIVLEMVNGRPGIAAGLIGLCVVLPALVIALREPLGALVKRNRHFMRDSVPIFILETVIGMFEVLLTYFTNTVSFVRVGAFALSHAGMMAVVLMLSRGANDSHNLAAIILGNVLVMVLEGLVVGIQVLRLQFYEMFSRFFDGDGRVFRSYKQMNEKVK